jgi:uncharacterized protein YijF (DUF1287 family)
VKKSAKSRKTARKSGSRNAKPQPKVVGPATGVSQSPEFAVSSSTAQFADATAWLNSLRPPTPNPEPLAVVPRSEFAQALRSPPPRPAQRPAPRPILAARAATTYDTDDRGTIFLMMAPFFVIALSLGISQTVKPFITSLPVASSSNRTLIIAAPQPTLAKPMMVVPVPPPVTPIDQAALAAQRLAAWTPPALPWPRDHTPPRIDAPPLPISTAPISTAPISTAPLIRPAPPINLPIIVAPPTPALVLPDAPPIIASPIVPDAPQFCQRTPPPVLPVMGRPTVPPNAVGSSIATAAREQTKDFVVYSAKYQRLSYPLGDLASFYGACSDVIIRAYRTIGLDLQELVQQTRVGRGDSNIDHRRTETLRRFFTQYGESLTPTAFPEDYQPGDIVTYYRPFSRVSRAHIAVVSDVRAPTGRFMIVHNRGWGPQLEDALFVDKITGHYRFDGTQLPPTLVTTATATPQPRVTTVPLALRPRLVKPGQLSRAPMMTPTSARIDRVH